MNFTYDEFISRNLGFVTAEEQNRIRDAKIFIPGLGGMGSVALSCLVRAGVQNFHLTDPDVFEVSNLNRQIFSNINRLGVSKVNSAYEDILAINPNIKVTIESNDWAHRLDSILPMVDLVINGCDDTLATTLLLRKTKLHQKNVVDAFPSTLPNAYVISPQDILPELRWKYPTLGLSPESWNEEMAHYILNQEFEFVLTNTSARKYLVEKYAIEMIKGLRPRISHAPMVWFTGLLMAQEAIKLILKGKSTAGPYGIHFDIWKMRLEKPQPTWFSNIKKIFIRRYMKRIKDS